MKPRFEVAPGPHSFPGRIQWAIQAHDLTLDECKTVRRIVCNQWMPSKDYQLKRDAEPFLQGYQEPRDNEQDGWVLVEFWSANREAIDRFVAHVNKEVAVASERREQ